ncbi:MAG: hypothetical protein GX195_03550 [Firmicutes bacterium]|nr:hypothetical protein [Bacillota bacterium]
MTISARPFYGSLQVRAICRELERGKSEKGKEYLLRLGEVLHQVQREMRDYVHGILPDRQRSIQQYLEARYGYTSDGAITPVP